MSVFTIFSVSIGYLALLFLIAYWAEKRAKQGRSIVNNPYVYTLSLAVYCTAWTYYGSVGKASYSGLEFLTIYIGPSLVLPLWWGVLRKVTRICKTQNITTLADFISARYGKSTSLGILVSLACFFGIVPYIALQIKAIASSFQALNTQDFNTTHDQTYFFGDVSFYITLILALFTIIFGIRNFTTERRNEGMVAAIAFESILKLLIFLFVGFVVSYVFFDGIEDIFSKVKQSGNAWQRIFFTKPRAFGDWLLLNLVSMFAILLLPRQFQVGIVENVQESHISKAIWLFPFYLLLINVFVLPLAMSGNLVFDQSINSDLYILALPLYYKADILALLVYLGGFAAATSMIIVSTIALSAMLINNLALPIAVGLPSFKSLYTKRLNKRLLYGRYLSVFVILISAYLYFKLISADISLVSIGLISFVAVAQFAPAFLGGLYWKKATKVGAIASISLGFAIWIYTLVLPTLAEAGFISSYFVREGFWGIALFKPHAFLGLEGFSPITQSFFWGIFFNTVTFVIVSNLSKQNLKEVQQSHIFVDIFKYAQLKENQIVWQGTAYIPNLKNLLYNFLGKQQTEFALRNFKQNYGEDWDKVRKADGRIVEHTEKVLSGVIGSASAQILIRSIVREEQVSPMEVYDILKESQEVITLNKELQDTSEELRQTMQQLQDANVKLKQTNQQKNDFIATITHELKTPITSIKAFCEILRDNPELEEEDKQKFTATIITETDRMTRLISQVLDLEKFDSGTQKLHFENTNINTLIKQSVYNLQKQLDDKNIQLELDLYQRLPQVYADRDRVLQVVLNLISNAIKYSENKCRKITVKSFSTKGVVHVEVGNNGKGIEEKYQDLIFEKFYQAENQTLRKPKGSGLGLAISKKIIESHQGKIWVESAKNQWTTFVFTLPHKDKK